MTMIDSKIHNYLLMCDKQGDERPSGFDEVIARKSVAELIIDLKRFLPDVVGPFEDQDCTYFARVHLPSEINMYGESSALYVSNFGRMVTIKHEERVAKEYLNQIKMAVKKLGFVWVAEADLLTDYDGGGDSAAAMWLHRFFDYV